MDQLLTIQDGIIKIASVSLKTVIGDISHTGSFCLFGDATINSSLNVYTITVRNLITSGSSSAGNSSNNWIVNTEAELNGAGLDWTWGNDNTQLIYRTGKRIWTNANFDIAGGSTYRVDNIPVLSLNELGPTVISSNLTKVGTLNKLKVADDADIGGFAFFNSTYGRLGLGTEDPSLAIDIVENNVNITIGSPDTNLATIGTYSNHDVGIITDNITRILVKSDGEIVVGNEASKTGVVRIYGSLYVDNLVTDTRVDRSSPLQFQATRDRSVYGLGLSWNGTGAVKQLIMRDGPDRLWTGEGFDIGEDKNYYINGQPVVSSTSLGSGITQSNLTTVGVLNTLTVGGETTLLKNLTVENGYIKAERLWFNQAGRSLEIDHNGFKSNTSYEVSVQQSSVLYGDANVVEIGDKTNTRKPVKVFGPLSVGINNPDPDLNFSVSGDVSIGNKRFTNGASAPASGSYELGDMCWNTNPQASGHIGWVCVSAGNPGQWLPFGEIKPQ